MASQLPASFLTPEEFIAVEGGFDYVVVGGGTAGLVVAARLSEDPNVTVAVLEAGGYYPDEPLINTPGYFGRSLGNPSFDWAYLTVPQKHVNGRPIFHPRGKMLGGSSGLHFMATGRATKEEYDAFGSIGNEGWNWPEMLKYMKKSETVHLADSTVHTEKHNATFDKEYHGDCGPIQKSFPAWASDISVPFYDALEELGVHRNPDSASGVNTGSYTILGFIDPKTGKRSYSASGYYAPNATRPNLFVLPNAQATKLILTGTAEPYSITGVKFVVSTGDKEKVWEVKAKKEVVLSTGSFATPQLLELSGIGRRDVLERVEVDVKIELPGVGENLQDHVYVASTYEVDPELETLDVLRDAERHVAETELYASGKGMYAATHSAFAFLKAKDFLSESEIQRMQQVIRNDSVLSSTPGQRKQQKLLQEWMQDERQPQIEIITYPGFFPAPGKTPKPGAHYHTVLVGLMHPSSRGTVHITSSNPLDRSSVDPSYLSNEVDRDLLVHAVRFVKKVQDAKPLKAVTVSYVEPAWEDEEEGEEVGEDGGIDDEELREYVKNSMEPIYHPAGTAAMFPREDGGVVDARCKVYGTTNLRIIDASVIPFHISAHPTSTIFGMAEKVADIIKLDAAAAESTLPSKDGSRTPTIGEAITSSVHNVATMLTNTLKF